MRLSAKGRAISGRMVSSTAPPKRAGDRAAATQHDVGQGVGDHGEAEGVRHQAVVVEGHDMAPPQAATTAAEDEGQAVVMRATSMPSVTARVSSSRMVSKLRPISLRPEQSTGSIPRLPVRGRSPGRPCTGRRRNAVQAAGATGDGPPPRAASTARAAPGRSRRSPGTRRGAAPAGPTGPRRPADQARSQPAKPAGSARPGAAPGSPRHSHR